MKFILILLFSVACIAKPAKDSMDNLLDFKKASQPETKERHLMKIVSKASEKVASVLNLSPFGFGIEGPDGIQGITLSYVSYKRTELDEMRKLMVELGQNLLYEVNLEIERENLEYGRLSLSFFYLAVNFFENEKINKESGDLFTRACINRDNIKYITQMGNSPKCKNTYTESFDEAYQKIYGNQN